MKDEKKENELNEPSVEYRTNQQKRITFFKSFEEENEYTHKMRAATSYEERLSNLEERRKIVYNAPLKNGEWFPLLRKFTVIKLPYEVCR